ncbi:amidohydrolase family protein [Nocardia miyunensis]|uniref:amidohydrolase family protein n=1 Tax=Nocardia miyunensis TaxID=282684 RepID=UPI000835053F|nr:amidohydrolase family protein [Nocardia miyunensis]
MRYIDIHTHVISPDRDAYPLDPLGGVQSGWSQERTLTPRQLLDAMDEAGADKAVVVQASTAYGFDNSYVADSVEKHGDGRLLGVGSVDILAGDATDRLDHWVNQRGLVGIRLFSTGSTMPSQATWLNDPRTFDAWGWMQDNDLPVCVQMRLSGIPRLLDILARFPRLRIVLDHAAQPDLEGGPPYPNSAALFELSRFENVHLKLTNDNFERAAAREGGAQGLVAALVEHFTARRIAWGTNFPATEGRMSDLVRAAETALAGLDERDRQMIFADTALSLYPRLREQES